MSELRAENLHFHFADGTAVLRGVNLTLRPGQMIAILGENASGKTTLLKLLTGLLTPTEGQVFVDDFPVQNARDRVGIVFQNPDHQMIGATVEEDLALGMELRGVPQTQMRERVEVLLQQFDLEDFRQATPENLSGGQKQRVALAAVMVSRPTFLLFDEPDSLLDAPSRADLEQAVNVVRKTCGIVWTSPHPKRLPVAEQYFELCDGLLHALPRI